MSINQFVTTIIFDNVGICIICPFYQCHTIFSRKSYTSGKVVVSFYTENRLFIFVQLFYIYSVIRQINIFNVKSLACYNLFYGRISWICKYGSVFLWVE